MSMTFDQLQQLIAALAGPAGGFLLAVWVLRHSMKLQETQAENYTRIAVSLEVLVATLRSCKALNESE